jgi:hypothetical protein
MQQRLTHLPTMLCAFLAVYGTAATGQTRTVTGAFTTTFRPDDGTTTTLSTPPPFQQKAVALLVPDGSPAGYTAFPITLAADNTFTVAGVPSGSYFLQLDSSFLGPVSGTNTNLFELTVDTPDLSSISAARPDLGRVSVPTQVTLTLSNLQPWETGNAILISSSQGDSYLRPASLLVPRPTPGITSYSGTFDWLCCSTARNDPGLPDALKNDVVFVNQRSTLRIGSDSSAADLRYASRYARVTDFTLANGVPSTLSASLVETPQTGLIRADVRGSQFAALATDVHPTARPTTSPSGNLGFSVQAVPRSASYPDMPNNSPTSSLFYFQSVTDSTSDFDYGTFAYPQFHQPPWAELRQLLYFFDVTLFEPGSDVPIESSSYALSWVPMSPAAIEPMAPVVGPPTAPLLNGTDAFEAQSGVGEQPLFSWSPPTLGVPTSYAVTIAIFRGAQPGDTVVLSAEVYSGTSFRVPPGFLKTGRSYTAAITARQAPWDVLNRAPLRSGAPIDSSECVIGIFTP